MCRSVVGRRDRGGPLSRIKDFQEQRWGRLAGWRLGLGLAPEFGLSNNVSEIYIFNQAI